MKIDKHLLLHHGAVYEDYKAKETIFFSGDLPRFYIQIAEGEVELNNYLEDGKEITIGLFSAGNSIGESLLFTDQTYPMNAVAKTDCRVLKLKKSRFLDLVKSDANVAICALERLSADLNYYYNMHSIIAESQPVSKIKGFLDYYKELSGLRHSNSFKVPLTRQEIAKIVGLRVETVVRTVKKMEQESMLAIKERKIYY